MVEGAAKKCETRNAALSRVETPLVEKESGGESKVQRMEDDEDAYLETLDPKIHVKDQTIF